MDVERRRGPPDRAWRAPAAAEGPRLRHSGTCLLVGCAGAMVEAMDARARFESLDEYAVEAIGRLFGVKATVEPYTPDGSAVFRVEPGGAADGIAMVIWPSLHRVDVSSPGNHGWVMKNVGNVEVIPSVEVVFKPSEGRGYLFVSVNGWVNMVVG